MKRRPKGMGSVTYLGKGRRKPFVATLNKKCIGTYKTKNECEKALLKYIIVNNNMVPDYLDAELIDDYISFIYEMQQSNLLSDDILACCNLEMVEKLFKQQMISSGKYIEKTQSLIEVLTFKEIWEIEYARLCNDKSQSWRENRSAGFKNLSHLHDMYITQIKISDIQSCFDEAMKQKSGISKLNSIKNVCSIVYNYAIRNEIIEPDRNLPQYIMYKPTAEKRAKRKPFTKDEIKTLFNDDTIESKLILTYIYTGMRPIELLTIQRESIHIEERYIIAGVKTEAGKNRIIPIHKDIMPCVRDLLNDTNVYLFTGKKNKHIYNIYRLAYHDTMKRLSLQHNDTYDTRHTFSTLSKLCNLDNAVRKKILGHSCNDITDDVYTHEPIHYLIDQIDKINLLDYFIK